MEYWCVVYVVLLPIGILYKDFEDIKGVIRICKLKKYR